MVAGGILALVGLVVGLIPGQHGEQRLIISGVCLLIGLPMGLVGAALSVGRWGADISRQGVTRWFELAKLRWSKTYSSLEPQRVELRRRVVRGRRGRTTYFTVDVCGEEQDAPVIYWETRETRARAVADEIAKFLHIELHDLAGNIWDGPNREVVIRQSEQIGISVGERITTGMGRSRCRRLRPGCCPMSNGWTMPTCESRCRTRASACRCGFWEALRWFPSCFC